MYHKKFDVCRITTCVYIYSLHIWPRVKSELSFSNLNCLSCLLLLLPLCTSRLVSWFFFKLFKRWTPETFYQTTSGTSNWRRNMKVLNLAFLVVSCCFGKFETLSDFISNLDWKIYHIFLQFSVAKRNPLSISQDFSEMSSNEHVLASSVDSSSSTCPLWIH